jgi:hypothetical protein
MAAAGDVEANCRDESERVGVATLKALPPRFAKNLDILEGVTGGSVGCLLARSLQQLGCR